MTDDLAMARSVRQIVELARCHVGMDAAWVSRFHDGTAHVDTVVHARAGVGPTERDEMDVQGSYCLRVLQGRLPTVVPDARADERTAGLAVTEDLNIGSYVGVPILTADGAVRGMLCCVSSGSTWTVDHDKVRFLKRLADLLAEIPGVEDSASAVEEDLPVTWRRLRKAAAGQGLRSALQPVFEIGTGRLSSFEALARFDGPFGGPDQWFADADRVGLRTDLELAAMRSALRWLPAIGSAVSLAVNASPLLITSPAFDKVLGSARADRVVLEITEHAAIGNYAELAGALARHRAAGLRVAIDDAGAGYASLRHILRLQPDIVKVDMSLISGIDSDPVRQALMASLVAFTSDTGVQLTAEGVERQCELDTLASLGVRLAQGYLLGRPTMDADEVRRLQAGAPGAGRAGPLQRLARSRRAGVVAG